MKLHEVQSKMIRVKHPSDVPEGQHYAIIVYNKTNVYVEGDQRSRDCPGHGYPAHTQTYDTFEHWVTTDMDDMNAFIVTLHEESLRAHESVEFVVYKAHKANLTLRMEARF